MVGDPAPPTPGPLGPAPTGGTGDGTAGNGGGSAGGQSAVNATGYLEKIAQIQCSEAFSCRSTYPGEAADFEATWSTSVDACVTSLQVAWGSNTIETEIAKGRIDFDGTAALNCLNAVTFSSCDTQWTEGIQWAESCYHVLVGTVPNGGNCESVYACSSFNCDMAQHTCI
jgi:hypothetical protein